MPLISIRIEDVLLDRLKAAADKHDVGYQTLLKMIVHRGLTEIEEADHVDIPDEVRKSKRGKAAKKKAPSGHHVARSAPSVTPPGAKVVPKPEAPAATLDEEDMDELFGSL